MIVSEDVGDYDQIVAIQPVKNDEQGELPINGKSGKHLSDSEYCTIELRKNSQLVFAHHLDPTLSIKKGQTLSLSFKVEPIETPKGEPNANMGITVKVVATEP